MNIVLDSWAILAFFQGEQPAADQVEEMLINAHRENKALMMATVNVGEVWYNLSRKGSEDLADNAVTRIKTMKVNIIPVDWEVAYQAARFKTLGRIAYADCIAAALAQRESALLLTGDQEFEILADYVNIHWLTR